MNQTSQFLPVYLAKIPEILLKVMADTAKQVDPDKIKIAANLLGFIGIEQIVNQYQKD